MKKGPCIDAIAYEGVPDGSRLVQEEPTPGLMITTINASNVQQSGALFAAQQLRSTLMLFLQDIPDNVELSDAHFSRIQKELESHYGLMAESLILGEEVRRQVQDDLRKKLQKLSQLRVQKS